MNKKNIMILSVIIILLVFIVFLFVYRFKYYEDENEKYYFTWTKLENMKDNMKLDETIDRDKYEDKIIKDALLKIDYKFFSENKSIKGQIYIGTDKYLYVSDINENTIYRVSTTKFKTMYAKDIEYLNGIYAYLISEDNKLYYFELSTNDIKDSRVNRINTSLEITNFVNLEFLTDINDASNTLFVLASDGNIYDVSSKIRYNENIKILYSNLYVFEDNTMVNEYGEILEDKNNKYYKIKNIFRTYDDNNFSGENTKIIITEDNKLLYIEDVIDYVYEFNKNVKDISFDQYRPYIKGNLKITFEDDSYVELKASCNQYYCINEFDD